MTRVLECFKAFTLEISLDRNLLRYEHNASLTTNKFHFEHTICRNRFQNGNLTIFTDRDWHIISLITNFSFHRALGT